MEINESDMEKGGAVQDLVQKPHLHIFTSTKLAMGSMLLDDNTSFTICFDKSKILTEKIYAIHRHIIQTILGTYL